MRVSHHSLASTFKYASPHVCIEVALERLWSQRFAWLLEKSDPNSSREASCQRRRDSRMVPIRAGPKVCPGMPSQSQVQRGAVRPILRLQRSASWVGHIEKLPSRPVQQKISSQASRTGGLSLIIADQSSGTLSAQERTAFLNSQAGREALDMMRRLVFENSFPAVLTKSLPIGFLVPSGCKAFCLGSFETSISKHKYAPARSSCYCLPAWPGRRALHRVSGTFRPRVVFASQGDILPSSAMVSSTTDLTI